LSSARAGAPASAVAMNTDEAHSAITRRLWKEVRFVNVCSSGSG
jgi:hypothetical protein